MDRYTHVTSTFAAKGFVLKIIAYVEMSLYPFFSFW